MMPTIQDIEAAGPDMWSVTRCAHGCLHVHLGRCSVTLTPEEFQALRELLTRATLELGLETPRLSGAPTH